VPVKKQKLLAPDQISKLIRDSDSDAYRAPDSSSNDKGGYEYQPRLSHLQLDHPISSGQASSSSYSSSDFNEEEVAQSGPGQQLPIPSTSQ
jgi:hypothetical protein